MKTEQEVHKYICQNCITRKEIHRIRDDLLKRRDKGDNSPLHTREIAYKIQELMCEFDFAKHPTKERAILIHLRAYIFKNFPNYVKRFKF